jgi:hypothetical protein
MKKSYWQKISLVVLSLVALVILGLPSTQAVAVDVATNDRCGPRTGAGCETTGALDVPQAAVSGRQYRQCYSFDVANATAGPYDVDVVGTTDPIAWPADVWFRLPGPHCYGKRVIITTGGSTYTPESYLVTAGGGSPWYICDTTCDNVAGNSFFDDDVVSSSATGNYNVTLGSGLANRDIYVMVKAQPGGLLRYCVTTACP